MENFQKNYQGNSNEISNKTQVNHPKNQYSKEPKANSQKTQKLSELTDSQLYQKCKEYGGNARNWMRKFAGLLPEVYRRHLYKRRGFGSIHEFAFKLAGMNYTAVDKVLNIAEKLKDKPALLGQLQSGEEGWSKLEKVAYVATPETDKEWAEKVKILPKAALEECVREYRKSNGLENRLDFTPGSEFSDRTWNRFSFPISPENEQQLRLLKQTLEKERKQILTWNEVMSELLKSGIVQQEIEEIVETETQTSSIGEKSEKIDPKTGEVIAAYKNTENTAEIQKTSEEIEGNTFDRSKVAKKTIKKVIIKICPDCVKQKADKQEIENPSRHIPADVKRIVDERSRGLCEYPLCLRPGIMYHHTKRFALSKNHDPAFIRYLCFIHNHMAHATLIENETGETSKWAIRNSPDRKSPKYEVDKLVGQHYQR